MNEHSNQQKPVYELEIVFDTETDEYLFTVLNEKGIPIDIPFSTIEHIFNVIKMHEGEYVQSDYMS